MSVRNRIHADDMSNPDAANALRTHTAERGSILAPLTAQFEANPRVRAAWLWGSFMRGEEDDLSDLDIWIVVDDDAVASFAGRVFEACRKAGSVIYAAENVHNAPPGGGYVGALLAGTVGLHHLDIYWQSVGVAEVPGGPLLVGPRPAGDSAVAPGHAPVTEENEPPDPNPIIAKLAFVWLMISITAKHLARDPASDMALLSYPRPAFDELRAHFGLGEAPAWKIPEQPEEKINLLRQFTQAVVEVEIVAKIKKPASPCLNSYLDLVEAILADATQ
jgi:hypothetical protein